MPTRAGYPLPAPAPAPALTLAKAGELALQVASKGKDNRLALTAASSKATSAFVQKHCRVDVSEEWTKVDDQKIAKLRGILAALQEENQATQLLKKESEDTQARRELEATRLNVDRRLAACKHKEELFAKQQAALRRHVMENEKALRELQATIEKGEKKSREEQAESRQLESEIKALEEELKEHEAAKVTEQKKIAQTLRYKRFLEVVVHDGAEDFEGDIENLMNRHITLEAGNQELHQANADLSRRLDALLEERVRVQTKLQNEHLMISSQLHQCQLSLERHRAESQELQGRLNRALAEKELKESQVGVIHMAIEQLFTRVVTSCRLKQRKKAMLDAVDVKFGPVRGDKSDIQLEEMLLQIIERVEDLRELHESARAELGQKSSAPLLAAMADEVDLADKVKIVHQLGSRHEHSSSDLSAQEPLSSGGSSKRPQSEASVGSGAAAQATGSSSLHETFVTTSA